jgi:glycosyltransferase involved in cell wall biosynthesis
LKILSKTPQIQNNHHSKFQKIILGFNPEKSYNKGVSKRHTPIISVIIPCFNEEEVLEASMEILVKELDFFKGSWEIIFVNDGSTDKTKEMCLKFKARNSRIRILNLPRNFGHMAAITAGLLEAKGSVIVTIDADLQDPPSKIKDMYELWQETKCDYVQGVRADRSTDTFFKRNSARIFYKLAHRITGIPIIMNAGDFRLITQEVQITLNNLSEGNKIYRFLIPWLGFKAEYLPYQRQKRAAGKTKYPFKKMLNLALDSFLSFSSKPLRLLSHFSLTAMSLMISLAVLFFLLHFIINTIPGWTSLIFIILASNAAMLAGISIIGEYIAKIYEISLNRPSVIYKEIENEG